MSVNPAVRLLIARYNFEVWNTLDVDKRTKAERHAKMMFPIDPPAPGLPFHAELMFIRAFDSELFAIYEERRDELANLPDDVKDAILRDILEKNPPFTPVGWVAAVKEDSFASFDGKIGSGVGPLLRLYTIQKVPLGAGWIETDITSRVPRLRAVQNGGTTEDIYKYMTPINWHL